MCVENAKFWGNLCMVQEPLLNLNYKYLGNRYKAKVWVDLPFSSKVHVNRAHQTGRSSRPISAEIALPWLQSEIVVALLTFASRSSLANNLHFKVKVIDKAIVINVKIHKNERKRLYSSNKENLTCLEKSITTNL